MDEKEFVNKFGIVCEELIIALLFTRKKFKTIESAIVFLSIWSSCKSAIIDGVVDSDDLSNSTTSYNIQKKLNDKRNVGTNIMGISRETNIPRTTVARIVDGFKKAKLVKRKNGNLIVDEGIREFNEDTRVALDKFFKVLRAKY